MPTDKPVMLSNDEVAEIEALKPKSFWSFQGDFEGQFVPLVEMSRDALCATVRALRDEREKAIKLLSPNIPRADLCDAARQIVFAHALEKGNAEKLQARLKEVEGERDALLKEVAASENYQAGLVSNDFRTRVINLCNEKGDEWWKKQYSTKDQASALLRAQADAAYELREAIEKLDHQGT